MMWAWVFRSRIGRGLLGAWVAVVGLAAIWLGGRKSAQADIKAKESADYVDTRRRMDNAMDAIHGDDPAAARRFLLERGKRPGDL
jgi:hypothetical protein